MDVMKYIKIKLAICLIIVICTKGLVAQDKLQNNLDLTLTSDDIRIVLNEEYDAYDLFVRKKEGIQSVLLTESPVNPNKGSRTYAYRSPMYTSINGNERRVTAGRFIASKSGFYIIDSNPQNDSEFGQAFRLLVPKEILYGFDSTERKGVLNILNGTYVSLRTFNKKYADYSGTYLDNSFAFASPPEGQVIPQIISYLRPQESPSVLVIREGMTKDGIPSGIPRVFSDSLPHSQPNLFSNKAGKSLKQIVDQPITIPHIDKLSSQEGVVALDPITGERLGTVAGTREGISNNIRILPSATDTVPFNLTQGNPLSSTAASAEDPYQKRQNLLSADGRALPAPLDNDSPLQNTRSKTSPNDSPIVDSLSSTDGIMYRDPITGELLPSASSFTERDPITGELLPSANSLTERDPITGELLPSANSLTERDPITGRLLPSANSLTERDPITGEFLPSANSLTARDPITGRLLPSANSLTERDPTTEELPSTNSLAGSIPNSDTPLSGATSSSSQLPLPNQALGERRANATNLPSSDRELAQIDGLTNAAPNAEEKLPFASSQAVKDPVTGELLNPVQSTAVPSQFADPTLPQTSGLTNAIPGTGDQYPSIDSSAIPGRFDSPYLPQAGSQAQPGQFADPSLSQTSGLANAGPRPESGLPFASSQAVKDPVTGELLSPVQSTAVPGQFADPTLAQTSGLADAIPGTGEQYPSIDSSAIPGIFDSPYLPQAGSEAQPGQFADPILAQTSGLADAIPGTGDQYPSIDSSAIPGRFDSPYLPQAGSEAQPGQFADPTLAQTSGLADAIPGTGDQYPSIDSSAIPGIFDSPYLPQAGSEAQPGQFADPTLAQTSGLADAIPGTGEQYPSIDSSVTPGRFDSPYLPQAGSEAQPSQFANPALPQTDSITSVAQGGPESRYPSFSSAARDPVTGQLLPQANSQALSRFVDPSLPQTDALANAVPESDAEYPSLDANAKQVPATEQQLPSIENAANEISPSPSPLPSTTDGIEQAIRDQELSSLDDSIVQPELPQGSFSSRDGIATDQLFNQSLPQLQGTASPQYPQNDPLRGLEGQQSPIPGQEQELFRIENPAVAATPDQRPFDSFETEAQARDVAPNFAQSESNVAPRLADAPKSSTSSELNKEILDSRAGVTSEDGADALNSANPSLGTREGNVTYDPITGELLPQVRADINKPLVSPVDTPLAIGSASSNAAPPTRLETSLVPNPPLNSSDEIPQSATDFQSDTLPSVSAVADEKQRSPIVSEKAVLGGGQADINEKLTFTENAEEALPGVSDNAAPQEIISKLGASPLPSVGQTSEPAPVEVPTFGDTEGTQEKRPIRPSTIIPSEASTPSEEPAIAREGKEASDTVEAQKGTPLDSISQFAVPQDQFVSPPTNIRLFPNEDQADATRSASSTINPDLYRSTPTRTFPVEEEDRQELYNNFETEPRNTFKPEVKRSSFTNPTTGRRSLFNLDERYLREAIEDYTAIGNSSNQRLILSDSEKDTLAKVADNLRTLDLSKTVDIAFVVDSTHSMWNDLPIIRQGLPPLLSTELDGARYRIGVVTFRDYGEDYVTQIQPFSNQVSEIEYRLNQIRAKGGGNKAEAVHEGIAAAVERLTWISEERVIFLIGDAPGHSPPFPGVDLELTLDLARDKNIRIVPILLPNSE